MDTIEAQVFRGGCMVSYGKVHYFVVNDASFPTPHFRVEVVLTAKAAGCLHLKTKY